MLAGLVWFPQWAILAFSLVVIAGHNLLDGVHFPGSFIWSALHDGGMYKPFSSHAMLVAYPLLPWVAVMSLGYAIGPLYKATFPAEKRRQILSYAGFGCIALFIILTASNVYGNPVPFKIYPTASQTLMSFLNQEKYPPSLRYLLMTLGPAFVLLANTERLGGRFVRFLSTFGRVPFFYYVLHLFLIHALAMLAAELSGFGWQAMVLPGWIEQVDALKGYGFSLGFVYAVWVAVVLMLYPLCRVFEVYKMNNKAKWWLSYL